LKENPFSAQNQTKILQSIYFAYKVGIISSYSNRISLTYRLHLSLILNSLQMFIRIIKDILKPDYLLYQKHAQTQKLFILLNFLYIACYTPTLLCE